MVDLTYQKFTELRALYGDYHTRLKKARRFYDLDFEREVMSKGARARGIKAVVPRTARRAIDEAVDHVLTVPKVKVPVRPTDSGLVTQQEIAEKKRKACLAWWRQITQRYNPIGDARKWLFLDGMIAIKHTLRLDLLPDQNDPKYREKIKALGRSEFMWETKVLNNEWVYADPSDHRNPEYVYVAYSLSTEAARKKFPRKTGASESSPDWRNGPDYSKVNYLEGWSAPTFTDGGEWEPGQFRQWIEQEMVHDADNPYPYVPIAIEDSGYGLVHEGITIEDKFVGLLDHSFSVLVAQGRQWTAMEAVAELTAFNPLIARNISAEKLALLDVNPGSVWSLDGNLQTDPDAEDLLPIKWPDIPLTVLQMIQMTDREVNGALKSDTLGGVPQKGVDTATEADQNIQNASAKLTNPVAALERLAVKLTRWFLMDIELVIEAPMTLYGVGADDPADVTLTPRDISHYYDVFVQLGTSDEEALQLTKARFWGDMYRILPFLSAWTAMERGGISDDPLAEMIRRAGEDVFLSEEFRMIRVATGAQSFGELATMLQQMMAAQGGAAPTNPGAGSDQALVSSDGINSPPQDRVVTDAMANRDINQGGSQNRGPSAF